MLRDAQARIARERVPTAAMQVAWDATLPLTIDCFLRGGGGTNQKEKISGCAVLATNMA